MTPAELANEDNPEADQDLKEEKKTEEVMEPQPLNE